jgi:PDZ domain-containing protein
MAQAKAAAKTAALRRLGYAVPEHDAGAVVDAVSTGTPADRVLKVGQVITAVDGTPTENVCAFVGALAAHAPGERVTLRVVANRFSASGAALSGPVVNTAVRLGTRPADVPAELGCPGVRAGRAFLGISTETQQEFSFPFRITINTAGVGGPSAGLAMTLGLLNTLSGGNLTGGHTVAATGTIDPSGRVGDVGGVALKTVAVERAGASVFFVPGPELSAARSKATPTLRVYAVNTLAQALSELQRLGGHIPGSARTP